MTKHELKEGHWCHDNPVPSWRGMWSDSAGTTGAWKEKVWKRYASYGTKVGEHMGSVGEPCSLGPLIFYQDIWILIMQIICKLGDLHKLC